MRKINKGLLLTIVVAVGVIIYLIVASVTMAGDKRAVSDLAVKYINAEIDSCVFPEKYVVDNKVVITDEEMKALTAEIKESLKSYYKEDGIMLEYRLSQIEDSLRSQTGEYKRPLVEAGIDVFNMDVSFDGDRAVASVNGSFKSSENGLGSFYLYNTVTFVKENGEWKIVKADVELPSLNEPDLSDYDYYDYLGVR